MKNVVSFKNAIQLSLVLFGLITLFHLIIIVGIVAFDYAPVDFLWGGRMKTAEELLSFEFISLLVMILCFFIVLIRSGRIGLKKLMGASRVALWILTILFVLNTLGNVLAKTSFEKAFAVVTAFLALLCFRMAVEKINGKVGL